MDLTLVVMAAGLGSRYGGLKQVEPVGPGGELLLEYSLYDSIRAGFGRAVFVIKPEIETIFKQRIGSKLEGRLPVGYAYQRLDQLPSGFEVPRNRLKPWGTAHAVLAAREYVSGPFAVINGDDFYGRDSFAILADFLRKEAAGSGDIMAMVGYPVENTLSPHGPVARGLCLVDGEGFLREIVERPQVQSFQAQVRYSHDGREWYEVPRGSLASMNLWGFPPNFLSEVETRFSKFLSGLTQPEKEEYYLPAVVNELIQEDRARVRVLPTRDRWFGITYRQDRDLVASAIADLVSRGLYPQKLWT